VIFQFKHYIKYEERNIKPILKIISLICILWGVFIILIAYGNHIQQNLELGNFLTVFLLGVTYLISGSILFRCKAGLSFCSSQTIVNYTIIASILFFVVPILNLVINNGELSKILFIVYENGFIFGPLLISCVLAMNLQLYGNELQKRHAKYIFWILLSVAILILLFILVIVGAVISSLP